MTENEFKNIPLCVDLDGTIVATDTLFESLLLAIKSKPYIFLLIPLWLLKGRAFLKEKIAGGFIPNPVCLPYREDVLKFIKEEKNKGRQIILATASNQSVGDAVSAHLGIFDKTYGSTGTRNLRSSNKKELLVELYGEKGFDYIGDSKADLKVWESAANAIMVNPGNSLKNKAVKQGNVSKIFEYKKNKLKFFIKEIRVHQWLKNLLIFLPMIMAHKIHEPVLFLHSVLAFLAFSFCASSVYITNDLLDLESDRMHPRKRTRPVASGNFPIHTALFASFLLLIAGLAISYNFLPFEFSLILLFYLVLTTSYSFYLKRIYIIDIILLSLLYTIRLIAGASAVRVPVSKWLLAFSVFIFLSLAIVKRYTELKVMKTENKTEAKGRGYYVEDLSLLLNIGPASGYLSVLVFALYIYSNEIVHLYKRPELLWPVAVCILFWITRIWFLAHRGKMHDDPIVFTGKDPVSYIIGFIIALLVIGAAL